MPNWCHNSLTISGSPAEILKFQEKAKREGDDEREETPLTFDAFVPEPEEFSDEPGVVMPRWYSWRVENWGTKWDANFSGPFIAFGTDEGAEVTDGSTTEITEGDVAYQFDTAWSPPVAAVAAMAQQHPDLKIDLRYGEPGMEYGGHASFRDGEMKSHEEGTAEEYLTPDQMWF